MNRAIAPAFLVAMALTGCMPEPALQPRPSPDAMATWANDMAKTVIARRFAYANDHPNSRHLDAIRSGVIEIGMDDDEIFAAGYTCTVKERSTIGSVEACQDETAVYRSQAFDMREPGAYYVGLDADGKVVSVQDPADEPGDLP